MLKRFASAGFFMLLVTSGGACQDASQSFPDAPSARAVTRNGGFDGGAQSFAFSSKSPNPSTTGSADLWRQSVFVPTDSRVSNPERSSTLLGKYLNPSAPQRSSSDHVSDSGTMIGRATNAAARIFLIRDESGRDRVNTSYFLRALTAVAADTASRPCWRRSATGPFSDFGSTVGNDAGMNLLREFGPGLQHLAQSHAPKFVARIIGERLTRN
jgi:hypothetical protein